VKGVAVFEAFTLPTECIALFAGVFTALDTALIWRPTAETPSPAFPMDGRQVREASGSRIPEAWGSNTRRKPVRKPREIRNAHQQYTVLKDAVALACLPTSRVFTNEVSVLSTNKQATSKGPSKYWGMEPTKVSRLRTYQGHSRASPVWHVSLSTTRKPRLNDVRSPEPIRKLVRQCIKPSAPCVSPNHWGPEYSGSRYVNHALRKRCDILAVPAVWHF
jgi:hypothetical protein